MERTMCLTRSISYWKKERFVGLSAKMVRVRQLFSGALPGCERHSGKIESTFDNLKNHLGLLQTDPYFFPRITGQEYLRLLCNARGIRTADFEARNIFELPLKQYALTYSTGMKKKLALMGILLQENDFFILDEPFNGVDIQSNIIITEIIRKVKGMNKIILISSHIFLHPERNV